MPKCNFCEEDVPHPCPSNVVAYDCDRASVSYGNTLLQKLDDRQRIKELEEALNGVNAILRDYGLQDAKIIAAQQLIRKALGKQGN